MWYLRIFLVGIALVLLMFFSWKIVLPWLIFMAIAFSLACMAGEQDVEQNTPGGPEYLRENKL